jgi:FixJ family two-component response regulator
MTSAAGPAMPRNQPVIAIVDDDASVCRALSRLVRSLGFVGATFDCGERFLGALTGSPPLRPDCLVLDVHMPGLSGLQIQERLAGTALPIIFITAHDDASLWEQALAGGAAALLHKPFDDQVFIDTLRAALAR